MGRWLRTELWGRRRKRSELSGTVIWLAEGTEGVEAQDGGALALNTGWSCSQPHEDTDGKNKHFQVAGPPGVGGEGEDEAAQRGRQSCPRFQAAEPSEGEKAEGTGEWPSG